MTLGLQMFSTRHGEILNTENYKLQRVIVESETGTSNGSAHHPNFNSDDGYFYINQQSVAITYTGTARPEYQIFPDLDWNNTTKMLSWTFESPTINAAATALYGTLVNTNSDYYLIGTSGEPNSDNTYGLVIRNNDSQTTIDSMFQNTAVERIIRVTPSQSEEEYDFDDTEITAVRNHNVFFIIDYSNDDFNKPSLADMVQIKTGDILFATERGGDQAPRVHIKQTDDATEIKYARVGIRDTLDIPSYGLVIQTNESNDSDQKVVLTNQDLYPQIIHTEELDDLENIGLTDTRIITHIVESDAYYSYNESINPYYHFVIDTNDNQILRIYKLGIKKDNNTTLTLGWYLFDTFTTTDFWNSALDDARSITSGSINGFLAVFSLPEISGSYFAPKYADVEYGSELPDSPTADDYFELTEEYNNTVGLITGIFQPGIYQWIIIQNLSLWLRQY